MIRERAGYYRLDSAIGKPKQFTEVSEKLEPAPPDYKAMSDEELWAIIYADSTESERERAIASGNARRGEH